VSAVVTHDYAILGGGPAGLQLGHLLDRAGRDYVCFESASTPGAFFRHHPRHRRLLSINKVHTGVSDQEASLRFDWNSLLSDRDDLRFGQWTDDYFPDADVYADYLESYAERLGVDVRCGVDIVSVARDGDFVLTAADGSVRRARRVVVATGLRRPHVPSIPGIEHGELYEDMPVDPAGFRGARVLIMGKGNSAFETANHLTPVAARIHVLSPQSVEMAWRTHYAGHLRAVNNDFLDTYQLKSQNAVLDAHVERIERVGDELAVSMRYEHAQGEVETLRYDRVLVCTGFRCDTDVFDASCTPALIPGGRLPQLTSEWESTSVPDLFFAGVLMASRDFKRSNSAFIHGFRYNVRALSRMLGVRYHGDGWPSDPVPSDPAALTERLLERLNSSSALWQQFGFLCDVVTLDEGQTRLYPELPVDHVLEADFPPGERRLVVNLEFGPHQENPFHIVRTPDPAHASQSTFLHPVLRIYDGTTLVSEHHVLENLLGEWRDADQHAEPLRAWLETVRKPLASVR
jgi:thioredoxin reductase